MVTAGFEATVAPLGTALTDEQLGAALEDGGRADALLRRRQRRPARRLPRGRHRAAAAQARQEPAVRDCCRKARIPTISCAPAAARRSPRCSTARARSPTMLWTRETEAGPLRHAGAPRRAGGAARRGHAQRSATRPCASTTGRTFGARLRQLLAPSRRRPAQRARRTASRRRRTAARQRRPRQWPRSQPRARRLARRPRRRSQRRALCGREPAARRQPGASRPPRRHAAARGADPAGVLNHPWLLHDHAGGLFRARVPPSRRREAASAALIDIAAHDGEPPTAEAHAGGARPPRACRAARPGREGDHHRLGLAGARPEAGPDDVLMTWNQLIALHRQGHSLLRELKDAEQALGRETDRGQLLLVAGREGPVVGPRRHRSPDRGVRRRLGPHGTDLVSGGKSAGAGRAGRPGS